MEQSLHSSAVQPPGFYFEQPLYFGQEKDDQALEDYCRQVETALRQANDKARQILMQWK